jgi:hypothetical protein
MKTDTGRENKFKANAMTCTSTSPDFCLHPVRLLSKSTKEKKIINN